MRNQPSGGVWAGRRLLSAKSEVRGPRSEVRIHPFRGPSTQFLTTLAGLAGTTGNTDGIGSHAYFQDPTGLALDSSGTIYVADRLNETIRKIASGSSVSTLAGLAGGAGSADGGGRTAQFANLAGVAIDVSNNVFVTDAGNSTIRKVTLSGAVTTLAGTAGLTGSADGKGSEARFNRPSGLGVDSSGTLFVADSGNHTIRRVTSDGVVTTLAGTAGTPGNRDGVGTQAQFNSPGPVALDDSGNALVVDSSNGTIRRVTAGGVVSTLQDASGKAIQFRLESNLVIWQASSGIAGITIDRSGNVFVSDTFNNTIVKITPEGTVNNLSRILAGFPDIASSSRPLTPWGLAVDPFGNLLFTDINNSTVQRIAPSGLITTLGGLAGYAGAADGVGSGARFSSPGAIAVNPLGNLIIADSGNYRLCTGARTLFTISTPQILSVERSVENTLLLFVNAMGAITEDFMVESAESLRQTTPWTWTHSSAVYTGVPGYFLFRVAAPGPEQFFRFLAGK